MTHDSLYNHPLYYDIAFDRDVTPDIEFLEACMEHWTGTRAERIVELGCGPGYHTLALSRQGYDIVGIDINRAMIDYASHKAETTGCNAGFIVGDMFDFSCPEPVDLAVSMMATGTLIMSMDDMLRHLKAVARNVRDGGLYVMEMPHPADAFIGAPPRAAVNRWTTERDDITISIQWGEEDDPVDPVREIHTYQVTMEVKEGDRSTTYRFMETQAIWTPKEVDAAIRLSGVFDTVAWYGEFDINQLFNNSKWSWRMIPVMRKRGNEGE